MHGQRTASRRGRLALPPWRFRVAPRRFSVAFQRLAGLFRGVSVGLRWSRGLLWRLRANGNSISKGRHHADLNKELPFVIIKQASA